MRAGLLLDCFWSWMWFWNLLTCISLHFFFREADENKPSKEKHDGKEKSSGSRRGNRYHPYKDKHGGEKKGAHRNRVFISNIPYDMKWQAIKDLMREKGNVPSDGDGVPPFSLSLQLIRRTWPLFCLLPDGTSASSTSHLVCSFLWTHLVQILRNQYSVIFRWLEF